MLDYSKIENGNFVFLDEKFDLAGLVKEKTFQTMSF